MNGDGVADVVGSQRDYQAEAQSYASTAAVARADLLTEYRNGQGLRVQLQYTSALQQRDGELEAKATTHSVAPLQDAFPDNDHLAEPIGVPEPSVESWPVVDDVSAWSSKAVLASKSVTTLNMATATTSYQYADPRRCEAHKTHLGFRLVRESRPDQSSIETYYYQKHGRAGKVADQIAFDELERPVRSSHSVWRIPDPAIVEGGFRSLADEVFGVAFIGRLEEASGRNEYGNVVGESTGFESRTRYAYNDVAGYNFVDEIYKDDLGRSTRTEHVPSAKDIGRHLMTRVAQVKTYANLPGDSRLLAHRKFFYTDSGSTASRVKPSRIEDLDANRDAPSTSRWNVSHFGYASNGNLLEKRIQAATGGTDQVTTYCYDGPGCGGSSGQSSQSILAGVQDAAGKWSYFDVDDTFPVVTRSWSVYADVPTTLRVFDSFGRPVEAYFESKDSSWTVLLESIDYVDFPTSGITLPGPQAAFAPFRVSSRYSTIAEAKESSTIEVGNGAGSAFLAIELLREAGTSAKAIATESQVDAVAREVSRSDAFSCGANVLLQADAEYGNVINACLGISAASKDFTHSTLDALGRPVRVETPLGGIEIMEYSTKLAWTLGGGPGGAPHDAVLHKNANGGLKETLFAGSLPAVVRECNNTVMDPTLESLSGVSCTNPHETRFWYEPTGELRQVEDPTAPGTSCGILGPCLFMNQRFAYDYDTLGRVIKIHDPDAAVSTQAYDVFGNLNFSRDARGYEVTTSFDLLNRPTQINVSLESTPTVFSYLANQQQVQQVTDGVLEKQFTYDHMGRVEKTRWKVDDKDLYVNYEYDYLNRPTRIIYPTLLNGYKDTIVYEYEGAFLDRVCDIGVTAGTCSHGMATSIVSGIDYDAVGRPAQMTLPSVGTRSFEYYRVPLC